MDSGDIVFIHILDKSHGREYQVNYDVTLASNSLGILHSMKYLLEVAAIKFRFNAYVGEAKIEPLWVVGRTDKDLSLSISPEVVLEVIIGVFNINGEMISSCNGKNKAETRLINNWVIILIKFYNFYLETTVGTVEGAVPINFLDNALDLEREDRTQYVRIFWYSVTVEYI